MIFVAVTDSQIFAYDKICGNVHESLLVYIHLLKNNYKLLTSCLYTSVIFLMFMAYFNMGIILSKYIYSLDI